MTEEFVESMKTFDKKNVKEKMDCLATTLEKTIRYFTYRIEQLESKINVNNITEIKHSQTNLREIPSVSTDIVEARKESVREIGNDNVKRAIMGELNELFKKNKVLNHS